MIYHKIPHKDISIRVNRENINVVLEYELKQITLTYSISSV